MEKTVAFITLGCKVNQYETNGMVQKFLENGYKLVDNTEKADIYVIKNELGKQILLPGIKDVIKEIDVDNEKIIVHLIDGLV